MSMDLFNRNKVHVLPKQAKSKNNEKKKDTSLRSIISDYGERTTIHGLRYLILGDSFIRKLIWFIFIFCSLLYFVFNDIRLFMNFFEYPTMTKNEIIKQQKMLFPAITICNYNAIKQPKFEAVVTKANEELKRNFTDLQKKLVDSMKSEYDIQTLYKIFGHTMDEDGMFVSCKWKGKSCGKKDFRSSVQSIGLCHTFNSGTQLDMYSYFDFL